MTPLLIAWSWQLDGWIVAAGALCAVASALLGNFLVLRRMSLLGDAISHAVLPGLAAAFFISESRSSLPMFIGAVVVGVLTALFTEWIHGIGKVDEGASMGVVFTSLFALGLVMIVQAADRVDLDPGCVLYGSVEFTPLDKIDIAGMLIPRAVVVLAIVAALNAAFVALFYKELKLSSFDPALATTMGYSSRLLHYGLMVLVAVTAVASFECVGNILVVAMLIVPPATAYLLTDRLPAMIALSLVLACVSAVLGHAAAIMVPHWFDLRSTTTAGMIAAAAGLLFTLALVFGPRHGVFVKFVRQQLLGLRILADDVIALLYRVDERKTQPPKLDDLKSALLAERLPLKAVLWWLTWTKQLQIASQGYALLPRGHERAQQLVRSHRLWEQYLVSEAGVDRERIHDKAERFEHFTDPQLRGALSAATNAPLNDPHGSPIPDETSSSLPAQKNSPAG